MLFDLQGKRRRVVQVTYLGLAILMGGGLVLFGIGSDAQGGLLNGCGDDSTTGNGNPALEQRLEDAQARLQANPEDTTALTEVVRGNYQLANDAADPNTGAFGPEGVAKLQAASDAWQRYLELEPEEPDDSLAGLMLQAYGLDGLNDPEKAAEAADIVATARPSPNAFLALSQFAALAGQTRKADLAGKRAVELSPKSERKAIEQDVEDIEKGVKQLAAQQAATDASGAGAPAAGGQPGALPDPGGSPPQNGGAPPGGGQP